VLTGHKLKVAREMHASGQYTVAAIATTLGVSRASIIATSLATADHLSLSTAGPLIPLAS
jgi:hypothetical protein